MDEFVNTVNSQVYELSCLDVLVLQLNMQVVYMYENVSSNPDFMPFDALKHSFYKALQQFPIFVGYLKETRKDRFTVEVDKDNLNMPEYKESACDMHYSELKAAKFSWENWPKNIELSPIVDVDASGNIKNVKVHVVRLKANSGVIISLGIAHYLADGIGYLAFLKLWSGICKGMRSGEARSLALHQQKLCFDRSILRKNMSERRKDLDKDTRWFFTFSNIFSKAFAFMPLAVRIRVLKRLTASMSGQPRLFHISRESLNRMHESMGKFTPSDVRLSDNDLLSALIAKTFAQSLRSSNEGGFLSRLATSLWNHVKLLVFGKQEKDVLVTMAYDTRLCLGIARENYVGNASIGPYWKFESGELAACTTPESLADVAKHIRQRIKYIDSAYAASFMDLLDSDSSFHTSYLGCGVSNPIVVISNQSRLGVFVIDFGDGTQQWCSFVPDIKHNVAMIQPCPPGMDGVCIYAAAEEWIMRSILKNEYWMSVASVVY